MAKSPKEYSKLLKTELVELAKKAGLSGISALTKDEIVARLSKAGRAIEEKLRGGAKDQAAKAKIPPSTAKAASKTGGAKAAPRGEAKPAAERPAAARPAAAKPAPAKPAPAKSAPAKPAPTKSTSSKTIPVRAAARKAGGSGGRGGGDRPSDPSPADAAADRDVIATGTVLDAATTTTATEAEAMASAESTDSPDASDLDAGLPELPDGYADNRIVLLPRDPQWLYSYWDVTAEHKHAARRRGGAFLCLRLLDVTDVVFDGNNAHAMWEQEVHELARNWYLHVPAPGRRYCVEIGYRGAAGEWVLLARSNTVPAPVDRPAERVHDEFATIPLDGPLPPVATAAPGAQPGAAGLHETLLQAAGGAGFAPGSSPAGAEGAWSAAAGAWSGAAAAWSGVWSGASEAAPPLAKPRGFWLRADAELIVHGMTEPDARVLCGGREVKLGADGTFFFRLHFPDGVHDFPIEATSADGVETRAIRLTFQRRTQ